VHAPVEDKNDDTNDKVYEEVEYVFSQLYMHHMKNIFGDFNTKVGRNIIF
jgi:hypothetical protein